MMKKVSIVVPVWNSEKYLRQCLDSIVNQTLREIEIILIDDGSTDCSLYICREYAEKDNRIRVYTQNNTGTGPTRNRGIELAEGEYISFLDSDDFFKLDMLEKLYGKAKATNADIVGCDFFLFDDKSQKEGIVEWSVKKENLPQKKVFSARDCPTTILNIFSNQVWNQLYRRDFILKHGLKCQNLKNSNDVFLSNSALILAEKITFLEKRFIYHRKYEGQTVSRREEDWKAGSKAVEALKDLLNKKNCFDLFKVSFLNKAFALLYVYRTLREPVLGIWQNYFLNTLSNYIKKEDIEVLDEEKKKELEKLQRKQNLTPLLEDFYYHRKDKIIPIVFAINEKYVPYVGVTIQSIMEHMNPNRFYDIYILHTDLEEDSQTLLEELSHDNVRISCLNISEKTKGIPFYDKDHYSLVMWYRLFIPELFYGYDKIMYLDTDTIVESDLTELFDTDLKEIWLAGCQALSRYDYAQDTLNLIGENYFNSGVLLLNIPLWKENNVTERCLELIDPQKKYRFPDQDILNIVCQNHTLILPSFWNCGWYYFDKKNENWFPEWYEKCFRQAKIIHYSSNEKPWNNPQKILANRWWKYARRSPFYETILFKNVLEKRQNQNLDSDETSYLIGKGSLMAKKETFYSDMAKFVKGTFVYFFCFGKKRKKRKEELGKLLVDMYKKV